MRIAERLCSILNQTFRTTYRLVQGVIMPRQGKEQEQLEISGPLGISLFSSSQALYTAARWCRSRPKYNFLVLGITFLTIIPTSQQ